MAPSPQRKRLLQFVEHRALGLGDLASQPQQAAGGFGDFSGHRQRVVLQFGDFFRRQFLAQAPDVVLPSLQHLPAGILTQPVLQQRVVAVLGLDAGISSCLDDRCSLFGFDAAIGPGDLNQRNHVDGRQRFRADIQFDQPIQHRLVVDAAHGGQLGAAVHFFHALAKFLQQLLVASVKKSIH